METRRSDVLRASPRMFESNLLDALSRVHPAVPLVLFLPAIGIFAALGFERLGALPALGWMLAGYVTWTLTEYWLHRVVFHWEPEHTVGRRLHWIIHGVHHDHPNDPMRLVMPPSVSIPLAALFYAGFALLIGSPEVFAFEAAFLAGYLFYDMTHYHVHHHAPKSRLGKRLRELHMRHHFQDHTTGFGVSAPWWDHVFRTRSVRTRR